MNNSTLWFGRDPMGRRSLLLHRRYEGDERGPLEFMLCSVLSKEMETDYPMEEWVEVPADKIYSIQFPITRISNPPPVFELEGTAEENNEKLFHYYFDRIQLHDWCLPNSIIINAETVIVPPKSEKEKSFELSIPEMYLPYGTRSKALITNPEDHTEDEFVDATTKFIHYLGEAVRRRVIGIPPAAPFIGEGKGGEARLAVMFSGGIDSMLIAALATKYFPSGEPIELVYILLFIMELLI